uniref:Uncharacterized protein n=1 Tax=Clastoptera arizonana TaxID=38151 RepID=A0A1B6CRS6_9HEMI
MLTYVLINILITRGFHPNYFDKNPYYNVKVIHVVKKEIKKIETRNAPFYPPPSNKQLGGCKAGCFDKWPEYKSSPYNVPKDGNIKGTKSQKIFNVPFKPQQRNKTMYTISTIENKINIALNATNWKNFKPFTYTYKNLL